MYTVGVQREDENTKYIDIGPVNKMINMLSVWVTKGSESPEFAMHKYRVDDYLWLGRDGMKMQGTNGSQLWDCAFAVQGLIENPRVKDEFKVCVYVLFLGRRSLFASQAGLEGAKRG